MKMILFEFRSYDFERPQVFSMKLALVENAHHDLVWNLTPKCNVLFGSCQE